MERHRVQDVIQTGMTVVTGGIKEGRTGTGVTG